MECFMRFDFDVLGYCKQINKGPFKRLETKSGKVGRINLG